MKVVHIATDQVERPRRQKLSTDKEALRIALLNWKLKHNAKFDKQLQSK